MKMSPPLSKGLFFELDGPSRADGRRGCPSSEILLRCHRLDLSRQKRREVMDHLSRCAQCVQDSRFILNVLKEEGQLLGRLEDVVHRWNRRWNPVYPLQGLFARLLSPQAAVALTVAVVSALSYFLIIKPDDRSSSVRGDASAIELIAPLDEPSVSGSFVFKWNPVPGPRSYLVEVFDDSLALLWRSPSLDTDQMSPPDELLGKLGQGRSFFWMVTAVLADGKKVASQLQEFRLK